MGFTWNDEKTTTLHLTNDNSIEVADVDLIGLVMSADNQDIPNDLLMQISAQLSGQAPDQELVCHTGTRLPMRGEPVVQGAVRGNVVDVTGTVERFTVRVSIPSGTPLQAGKEIRFGGNSVAMLESVKPWAWQPGGGDIDKARKELPEFGNFMNLIVRAASRMPKIVKEVSDPDTEISINRVNSTDKMIIFKWAMPHEVRPAGTFPQEPSAGVAAAPDVQGIQLESGDGVRPDPSVGEVAV